eukprot:CAMPEP_0115445276 /NCGR_PEP_ID=MMETSP0271-20121206/38830_1 /TAXON_ID=71861 /ORGANISM="Scrippsiella trochoidea, Strain CCMP3099" /LENGTH=80 /DNA_ID=CAMNT_0002871237 /DNA_START=12 /DNA_END=254 /DNA_ORIENTATION=-
MEANSPVTFMRAPPPKATTSERFVAPTPKAHSMSAVRLAHDLHESPHGKMNLSTSGISEAVLLSPVSPKTSPLPLHKAEK